MSLIYKEISGRGERIRTSGLYVPNVALYQAKLHPEGDTPTGLHGLPVSGWLALPRDRKPALLADSAISRDRVSRQV